MQIFEFRRSDDAGPPEVVLTIGNFDGVHVGHQALIRHVVAEARAMGVRSALMTFHPHPQIVLRKLPPPMITTVPLRLRLFEQMGLDAAYFVPFTLELANLSPQAFVNEYLISSFRVRKLIIGDDFHFGRNRRGSVEVLEGLSAKHGFDFEVFPEVLVDGERVSSSRIREALMATDFAAAERLLGRPYSVLETVVRGAERGRRIGFPTMNLVPEHRLPLPFGVYASRIGLISRRMGGRRLDAVSNYGVRPTLEQDHQPTLETYIFDFDGEVYGEPAEVFPLRMLRPEQKFPSLEALRAQIMADRDAASNYLEGLPPLPIT